MEADTGGLFFDTKVIVNAYDATAPAKQKRARATIEAAMRADRFVISTQAMQEFYNVAARRRLMSAQHAAQLLRHLAEHTVVPANAESVLRALSLQQRRRFDVAGGADGGARAAGELSDRGQEAARLTHR